MSTSALSHPLTFLYLANYEKEHHFLQEARQQGCRVYLLTLQSLPDTARFPHKSLDDILYAGQPVQVGYITQGTRSVSSLPPVEIWP